MVQRIDYDFAKFGRGPSLLPGPGAMRKMTARNDWSCEDPGEIDGWGVGLRRVGRPLRWLLPLVDRSPKARMYALSRFDVVGL